MLVGEFALSDLDFADFPQWDAEINQKCHYRHTLKNENAVNYMFDLSTSLIFFFWLCFNNTLDRCL